jgi:hypothetical protein
MDKEAKAPPKPLGRKIFEGCGVSTIANQITYSVSGQHDPSECEGVFPDHEHICLESSCDLENY